MKLCLVAIVFSVSLYLVAASGGLGSRLHQDLFTGLQHLTRERPDYAAFARLKSQIAAARREKVGSQSIEDLPYFKVRREVAGSGRIC
jgi:hypothetical protein